MQRVPLDRDCLSLIVQLCDGGASVVATQLSKDWHAASQSKTANTPYTLEEKVINAAEAAATLAQQRVDDLMARREAAQRVLDETKDELEQQEEIARATAKRLRVLEAGGPTCVSCGEVWTAPRLAKWIRDNPKEAAAAEVTDMSDLERHEGRNWCEGCVGGDGILCPSCGGPQADHADDEDTFRRCANCDVVRCADCMDSKTCYACEEPICSECAEEGEEDIAGYWHCQNCLYWK